MSSAVPKIIIKPRPSAAPTIPTVTIPAPGTFSRLIAPPPVSEHSDDPADGEDDPQAMDVDSPVDGPGGDEAGGPRPRGRPKGRGRGLASGTSTPRVARGKGRGRARGKGRVAGSLLIRLPKRGDEEADADVEGDVEGEGLAEGEGEVGDGGEAEVETPQSEEPKEKEEPLGGGKPFRKIQGKVYVIDGDEFVTDDDPKGDEKIDRSGVLLGGRRFKASTFILPSRHPTRQYMLAIDAARTSGFRDSLYYFRRNLLAFKLNATQPEKDYLISAGKLGSHLRTRSVTLITARSAFKLHGSKMVIDGRWVVDDYYEDKVIEEITALGLKPGDPVGELPDPNAPSHSHEVSALAAATAAAVQAKGDRSSGGIYRAGGPTTLFGGSGWGPYSDGPLNAVRKSVLSRDGVTEENWMLMMATRVLEAGEEWTKWRKESVVVGGGPGAEGLIPRAPPREQDERKREPVASREDEEDEEDMEEKTDEDELKEDEGLTSATDLNVERVPSTKKRMEADELPLGVYEPHSGLVQYHDYTQPTQCRWEAYPDPERKRYILGGTKVGNGAWALAWVDTVMELDKEGDVKVDGDTSIIV